MKMWQRSRRGGVFAQYSRSLKKKKKREQAAQTRAGARSVQLGWLNLHICLGCSRSRQKKRHTHGIRAGRDKSETLHEDVAQLCFWCKVFTTLFPKTVKYRSCFSFNKFWNKCFYCNRHCFAKLAPAFFLKGPISRKNHFLSFLSLSCLWAAKKLRVHAKTCYSGKSALSDVTSWGL